MAQKAQTAASIMPWQHSVPFCQWAGLVNPPTIPPATAPNSLTKLIALPNQGIIDGFKGVIDFYVWMGIPVARSWPRKTTIPQSSAERAAQVPFTYVSREWQHLSPTVQAAFNELATNSGLTGRDMLTRAYISGLYRYPTP